MLRKRCPVGGLEVATGRGRECPNRSAHGAIMARKAKDANQRQTLRRVAKFFFLPTNLFFFTLYATCTKSEFAKNYNK